MTIEVNNKRSIEVAPGANNTLYIAHKDSNGNTEKVTFIPEHEIVMLLNYYYNCKNGIEKSDYIQ